MTPLDFLYLALGIGFIILVIFLCVMLLNLTLVLRDVNKATANLKDISERIREVVLEPVKALSEMTAGLGFVSQIVEKIKSRFSEVADEDFDRSGEEGMPKTRESEPKKKGFFSVKKLGK